MMEKNIHPRLKPAIKTLIRSYGLGWTIATIPGLLAIIFRIVRSKNKGSAIGKAMLESLPKLLKASVTKNGLPLLLAFSFGGHSFLSVLYEKLTERKLSKKAVVFWSSLLGIWTTRILYPSMKTLDLTYLVFVRALDVFAHRLYESPSVKRHVPKWILDYGNIFVFMVANTEIIFSWFFEIHRLPRSYGNWITKMSAVDNRVLQFLKDGRSGKLVYGKETDVGYLKDFCDELGLPRSYGDPLTGRIDCSIIHEGSLWGCEVNALNRVLKGFIQIFPVNLMVHLLPLLLFKPSRLAKNPFESMSHVLASTVRSSTFLGSYIGIIWYCVCLVRTRIGHQVLGVNQTRLDNTLGPLLGSMLCGLSLLIENKHRRGEIILYVLPRALHSTTGRIYNPLGNQRWWKSFGSKLAEDVLFAASTMVVIHNIYRDEKTIRPSIRRAMTWILKDELAYEKEAQKKVSDNQIKKLEEEEQGLEIRKRRSLTP